MTYIIIPLFACALGLLGFLAHRKFSAFEKTLARRLDLVLRASHTCASKVSITDEKIERLHHDQRVAFVHQKKANEHQRVLLASLNRQARQLEIQLQNKVSGTAPRQKEDMQRPTVERKPPPKPAAPQTGNILKQAAAKADNREPGVIRLEAMFEAMTPSSDLKTAARQVDRDEDFVTKVRRVAHG